eukprot:scaffold129371_cov17-Tisochrysis_lutea.AAC.1
MAARRGGTATLTTSRHLLPKLRAASMLGSLSCLLLAVMQLQPLLLVLCEGRHITACLVAGGSVTWLLLARLMNACIPIVVAAAGAVSIPGVVAPAGAVCIALQGCAAAAVGVPI